MFLQMMRKGLLLLGFIFILQSCSDYQKVLKSENAGDKYTFAEKLYNEAKEEDSNRKYRKALRLFEQILPQYRGKPQGEKLSYLYADSYYQVGDYYLSSFEFERFVQSYPNSDKVEEASFKSAKSYYEESPRFDLDQTDTNKAVEALQNYLNKYPDGEYAEEANVMATELRLKLEKKAFEIAKQYWRIGGNYREGNFTAAITSFNNFIADYPGTPYREEAFYLRFDAAYSYAINSYRNLMQERLQEAKEYYQAYKKSYPDGEYLANVDEAYEEIQARLKTFN
ncbi:outer membrane protein assembly factor BamD [Zunongwangia sp. HRR-M8]|nr:outer membrane protein assembly factor BamD [Zunongwangia sp. HRR-M8]WBL23086.1 outer membrane protein assembly factor BamD [Zunongwangia sp. HRR-M8]